MARLDSHWSPKVKDLLTWPLIGRRSQRAKPRPLIGSGNCRSLQLARASARPGSHVAQKMHRFNDDLARVFNVKTCV